MRILFVASEVAPFSKTGGLADVSGALPRALGALGHEVKIITPRYGSVDAKALRPSQSLTLKFPSREERLGVSTANLSKGCDVWFLEHPDFGGRRGLYGEGDHEYGDNARRFALLSVGALSAAQGLGFVPDIVHANDWQTGLTPLALKTGFAHTPLGQAASVFTVHNLAYQGVFPKSVMAELGLPWTHFTLEGLEFYDQVSFLKAGLVWSDALTTVSPRYAEEIQTPEAGWGMDPLLRKRRADLHGILNGIDVEEWNPATDAYLPARFSAEDLSGKALCKAALAEELGVTASQEPLFGFVGRLVEQKGVDLLLEVLPWLLEQGARVVVVGRGASRYEQALRNLASRFVGRLGVRIAFDPALSHRLEAGIDFFLMPSLYEPCGLNQMYSLRYGSVPVVREVGGLADTVVDASRPDGTGFVFRDYRTDALQGAVARALESYRNPAELLALRRRGMAQDFSWDASARRYERLYRQLLAKG